jgi:hypothetical protein
MRSHRTPLSAEPDPPLWGSLSIAAHQTQRDTTVMRLNLLLTTAIGLLVLGTAESAAPPARDWPVLDRFFARFDRNNDGFIDRAEFPQPMRRMFARLDTNDDGKLSREELKPAESRLARFLANQGGQPGEVNTPAAKGERHKDQLEVGDVAPDFSLPRVKGEGEVKLSDFKGKRPVVLIFASYT